MLVRSGFLPHELRRTQNSQHSTMLFALEIAREKLRSGSSSALTRDLGSRAHAERLHKTRTLMLIVLFAQTTHLTSVLLLCRM